TKVIKYMANRLEKSGVEVCLNTPVTKEMLENEFKGYEVIAGCGAKANVIGAFTGFKHWMTADDILAGKAFPGRKIVIIGGGSVGCELADYLAPVVNDRFVRNRDITILEMAQEVMLTESGAGRSVVVKRLMEKGVRMECLAKVTEVTETEIKYEQGGKEYVISDADTLVFANGYHIESTVEDMLKEAGVTYHLIGDGCKVGNIKDAITQGYTVAKDLA
ncbi:MAG: FAD-dependent oxidoreductase, partial [Lachnospiraceae bacterium]|nr:FAD-dependent oxidoreductase [Lachnospiraceae bacterium]